MHRRGQNLVNIVSLKLNVTKHSTYMHKTAKNQKKTS
jgi:hypothetical protein